MTQLGRGLRVFAVVCVLASLLTVTALTSFAQDAGTPDATSTTTTQTQTTNTSESGDAGTTDPSASPSPSPSPSPDGSDEGTATTDPGDGTSSPAPSDTPSAEPSASPTDESTSTDSVNQADVQDIGSPAVDESPSPSPSESPSPSPAETGTVTFSAFLCDTVEAAGDPANNCQPADGLTFNVNNADENSATTGSDGTATVTADVGNTVAVSYSSGAPSGYSVYGSASQSVEVKSGDNSLGSPFVLVNSATGKVQVVNVACPTTGDSHTVWRIIQPNQRSMMAAQIACGPNAGASFTFSGGGLGSGSLTVVTDGSGSWKGALPAGTYTITEDATGQTASINVDATGISVATAITYTHVSNTGTLAIQIYACPAAVDSVEISVSDPNGTAPGVDPSCQPADGSVTIDGANPINVPGGAFNLSTIPEGSYTLESLGQSASFSIVAGQTTYAVIVHHVAMGTVNGTVLSCADPVSTDQSATDASFWQQNCTDPSDATLTLLDNDGNSIPFGLVPVGHYSVAATGGELCAVFLGDGSDASGGFDVTGGATIDVTGYICTRPSDNGGSNGGDNGGNSGGDTGGNSGGTTNGGSSNGDGTGMVDWHTHGHQHGKSQAGSTGSATVTQLPNTGAGAQGGNDFLPIGLSILLLALGAGAVAMERRRRAA